MSTPIHRNTLMPQSNLRSRRLLKLDCISVQQACAYQISPLRVDFQVSFRGRVQVSPASSPCNLKIIFSSDLVGPTHAHELQALSCGISTPDQHLLLCMSTQCPPAPAGKLIGMRGKLLDTACLRSTAWAPSLTRMTASTAHQARTPLLLQVSGLFKDEE